MSAMISAPLTEGAKFDGGKCRLDLFPIDALWETGKVYTMGAKKYADRNWEKGIKYGRVFAALLRHLFKWWCGEKYDKEDGQHHLSSVVWCALALLHYDLNPRKYTEYDDRPGDHAHVWEFDNAKVEVKEPPAVKPLPTINGSAKGYEGPCQVLYGHQVSLFPAELQHGPQAT